MNDIKIEIAAAKRNLQLLECSDVKLSADTVQLMDYLDNLTFAIKHLERAECIIKEIEE